MATGLCTDAVVPLLPLASPLAGQTQQDVLLNPTSSSTSTTATGTTIGDKISQELIRRSSFTGNVQLPISSPTRSRPLVSKVSLSNATVSQRRNYRRAKYLGTVSKRDDSGLFFGLFMLLIVPPGAILAVAFFTGYLELLS